MKSFILLSIILVLTNSHAVYTQDTFSICAVDPATGQVGSAGASCVNDCTILTDVHPGYGVVHTQAYWLAANQNYARNLMNLHLHPQAIIDSLVLHDAQNNPTIRQYGIVDLINSGRVAAYTGVNCNDYKNHITGPTYSIQGNILLGQQILDSMKSRFLNTPGSLAAKLMAALQGAKVIGADTRCASWNTSSKSAFLRVANPGDTLGTLYLDIKVLNTPFGRDPIDSLQVLFNNWITPVRNISESVPEKFFLFQNYPNPFNPATSVKYELHSNGFVTLQVYDVLGNIVQTIFSGFQTAGTYEADWNGVNASSGIYFLKMAVTSGDSKSLYSASRKMLLLK